MRLYVGGDGRHRRRVSIPWSRGSTPLPGVTVSEPDVTLDSELSEVISAGYLHGLSTSPSANVAPRADRDTRAVQALVGALTD